MSNRIKWIDRVKAVNGSVTGKVVTADDKSFLLHSQFYPEQEAKDWVKQVQLTPDTAYLVLGFGLGYHIRELAKALPDNCCIYVIEHTQKDNIFQFALKMVPPSAKLVKDNRISVMFGPDLPNMGGYIAENMRSRKIKKITVCRHFPSMQIYKDFYADVEKVVIKKAADFYRMNLEFNLATAIQYLENAWKNFPYIWAKPGIKSLYDKFKGKPAIIVSSGPSLNKNIEILKQYQNNAVIIASGSAQGACIKHGVVPDFLTIVDPLPLMHTVLENAYHSDTTLLMLEEGYHEIVSQNPGEVFFFKQSHYDVLEEYKDLLPETDKMNCSMSVATTAFDVALKIGAEPIIFVGQDLSFTDDDVRYAEGCETPNVGADFRNLEEEKYQYVPGYYGGQVRTVPVFAATLDYFQSRLKLIKDRIIINATEGGAYMQGATHMPLQEVAERYLKFPVNVRTVIDECVTHVSKKNYTDVSGRLEVTLRELTEVFDYLEGRIVHFAEYSQTIPLEDQQAVKDCLVQIANSLKCVIEMPGYRHVSVVGEPVLELFMYQQREGLADVDAYALYFMILQHLAQIFKKLEGWVRDSLQVMHENNEAVSEGAKNCRL